MDLVIQLQMAISEIRAKKPLILNLTNYVTQDFMANALLALGAAPIMSHSSDEIGELVALAGAVNINLGTLNDSFKHRVATAIKFAELYNKCIILDPVGCGATKLRTSFSQELLPVVDIIRGNASEIIALAAADHKTLGVESLNVSHEARQTAQQLAKQYNKIIVVSGATDLIISPQQLSELNFGTPLMQLVTGMGCVLSSVIAAFAAVEENYYQASSLAVLYFTLCGEIANRQSSLPGSFKTAFLDALYAPDWQFITTRLLR